MRSASTPLIVSLRRSTTPHPTSPELASGTEVRHLRGPPLLRGQRPCGSRHDERGTRDSRRGAVHHGRRRPGYLSGCTSRSLTNRPLPGAGQDALVCPQVPGARRRELSGRSRERPGANPRTTRCQRPTMPVCAFCCHHASDTVPDVIRARPGPSRETGGWDERVEASSSRTARAVPARRLVPATAAGRRPSRDRRRRRPARRPDGPWRGPETLPPLPMAAATGPFVATTMARRGCPGSLAGSHVASASVAQWIERLRPKEGVGSSILSGGTTVGLAGKSESPRQQAEN